MITFCLKENALFRSHVPKESDFISIRKSVDACLVGKTVPLATRTCVSDVLTTQFSITENACKNAQPKKFSPRNTSSILQLKQIPPTEYVSGKTHFATYTLYLTGTLYVGLACS